MDISSWLHVSRKRGILAAAAVLLLLLPHSARADEVEELKQRLEALERQHAALLERMSHESQFSPINDSSAVPAGFVPPPAPSAVDGDCAPMTCDCAPMTCDCCNASTCDGSNPSSCNGCQCGCHDPLAMEVKWVHGLEATTKDKKFRVHVGGRTQFDSVWLDGAADALEGAGGDGDEDALFFRRGRFRIEGTMYEFIDWAAEYDFVNAVNLEPGPAAEPLVSNVPGVTDMWVTWKQLPLFGNIRVGNMKEPIGFDHLHSSRFLDFMERSFNQDAYYGAFNNGFSPGVMIFDTYAEERGTWWTGVYKNTTNVFGFGVGDSEYAWTSRLTYLPYYDECSKGANLLHLGIAGSLRDPNEGTAQFRARAPLRNGPPPLNPVLANTSLFNTDEVALAGLEAAGQWGPLLVEAEFMGNWNSDAVGNGITSTLGAPLGTVYTHGWYTQALYFLTGEHRDYDRKAGVFTRVIPHENFNMHGGLGAWQVGGSIGQLILRDDGIDGGMVEEVTVGLNWFMNPNMKLQANYAHVMREAPAPFAGGEIDGFGMRLAFDF